MQFIAIRQGAVSGNPGWFEDAELDWPAKLERSSFQIGGGKNRAPASERLEPQGARAIPWLVRGVAATCSDVRKSAAKRTTSRRWTAFCTEVITQSQEFGVDPVRCALPPAQALSANACR